MSTSLEQQRAKFAWDIVQTVSSNFKDGEFKTAAKGAPALIMTNGLMASLAFWQSRSEKNAARALVFALMRWLKERKIVPDSDFSSAMVALQKSHSTHFMQATNESLEFLKWLRHFAAAVS